MVSWGIGCGGYFKPGVYAKVAYYADWIEETILETTTMPTTPPTVPPTTSPTTTPTTPSTITSTTPPTTPPTLPPTTTTVPPPQFSECIFGMEQQHYNPCAAIQTKQVNKTRCQELCDGNPSCNSWTFKVTQDLEVGPDIEY